MVVTFFSNFSNKRYAVGTHQNFLPFLIPPTKHDYRIRPNYRTYPYKRTVKKFRSLQITASVLFFFTSLQRHMLWVLI